MDLNHGDEIMVPRDDEASCVAFLLCLTRMYLWMLFLCDLPGCSSLMAASGYLEADIVGGFGKTQIRVDAYFVLKKIETDWAPEWARTAGSEGPRPAGLGPFWPLSVPSFAVASSPYSSS